MLTQRVLLFILITSCGYVDHRTTGDRSEFESLVAPLREDKQSFTTESLSYDYVRIPRSSLTADFVNQTGFIRDHLSSVHEVFGYLPKGALKTENSQQIKPMLAIDQIWTKITLVDEAKARHFGINRQTGEINQEPTHQGDQDGPAWAYHNYEAMTADLAKTAQVHSDIVQVESIGKSVQGREIWMAKVADHVEINDDKPKILYVANMHGDEVIGREVMLQLVHFLSDQYRHDPRVTQLVNNSQIYIIPSMNPDGYELGQRFNADGVDLNRNFPDFTSDPKDLPEGRAPETKAIMALFAKHYFVTSLNFHGGEVCFNLPWDTQPNTNRNQKFADDPLIAAWGRSYADLNPTMKVNSGGSFDRGLTYGYEWYEVNGGLQDWSIYYRGSTHATVELSYVKWPGAHDLPKFWSENKEALLGFLDRGREGLHLKIVNQQGELVGPVTLKVAGSPRPMVFAKGAIHRIAVPSGTPKAAKVTIDAPGYQTLEATIPWESFTGKFSTAIMKKQRNTTAAEQKNL